MITDQSLWGILFPKDASIFQTLFHAKIGHIEQDEVLFYQISEQLCCTGLRDSFQQKNNTVFRTYVAGV